MVSVVVGVSAVVVSVVVAISVCHVAEVIGTEVLPKDNRQIPVESVAEVTDDCDSELWYTVRDNPSLQVSETEPVVSCDGAWHVTD